MLFISHSSKDKEHALRLQDRLRAAGYACEQHFLDSDQRSGIRLGEKWEKVIYDNLRDCQALLVLCSPRWAQSKWCFAELAGAKMAGKKIFPLVLEECDRSALSEYQAVFVNQADPAARQQAFARLLDELNAQGLGPADQLPWPNPDLKDLAGQVDGCPFPGLPAFDERYAAVYYGREREARIVLEELRQMRSAGEPRLLMIVGSSGSGKSSLLMAGVLPRLKHVTSASEWLVLPMLRLSRRNRDDALFETLGDDIVARYPPDAATRGHPVPDRRALREQFVAVDAAEAARAFLDAARGLAIARGVEKATVLLPMDQFEEFLAPAAGSRADKFLTFLEQLCRHRDDRLLVIGTMRSDYLDVYEHHPAALKAPKFHPWRLEPFPREQIENVIVKPAERAHVRVTPELVERLKFDTWKSGEQTTDALPLLAFTLEKLYRRCAGDMLLELEEYQELGGMEGAIRRTAEQILPAESEDSLPPATMSAVRMSFTRHLAQVNDKGEFVRLTVRWSDLDEAAHPILERFVSSRLLVKTERDGDVFVEVAHEAIFRCWEPLKRWLHESAGILCWRRDVRRDRQSAKDSERKWTGLSRTQLAVARDWPRTRRAELDSDEIGWIQKAIRRVRFFKAAAAIVALMVAASAGVAWWQRTIAESRKLEAEARTLEATESRRQSYREASNALWQVGVGARDSGSQLGAAHYFLHAAAASSAAGDEPQRRNLEFAGQCASSIHVRSFPVRCPEALGAQMSEQSDHVLLWCNDLMLWNLAKAEPVQIWENGGATRTAVFIHDESRVLSLSYDGTAELWEVGKPKPIKVWKNDDWADDAVLNRGGTHVLSWGRDRTLELWDVTRNEPLRSWTHDGRVNGAAFTRDESRVISWNDDGAIMLWDVWDLSRTEPLHVWKDNDSVNAATSTGNGSRVVSWSADGSVRLWDETETKPLQIRQYDRPVMAAVVTGDGVHVLLEDSRGMLVLQGMNKAEPVQVWTLHFWAESAVLTCDASRVLCWNRDGNAEVFDMTSAKPLRNWQQGDLAQGAVFAHDGVRALSCGDHGEVTLWDVNGTEPLKVWSHSREVTGAVFSSNGSRVLSWSADGTLKLWDAWDVHRTEPLKVWSHTGSVTGVVLSNNGSRVLSWSADGTVKLWDDTVTDPVQIRQYDDKVIAAAFTNEKVRALSTSDGGTVRLWDMTKAEPLQVWTVFGGVTNAVFARDGSRVLAWWERDRQPPKKFEYNVVYLLDVAKAEPLQVWEHRLGINGVVFAQDGSHVLSWSDDCTVGLWDVTKADPLQVWKHAGPVSGAAFMRDESCVLSCSEDGTMKLWDVTKADPLQVWKHAGPVSGAVFTRDESHVLSWTADGVLTLWEVALQHTSLAPQERMLELEVRSATRLDSAGQLVSLSMEEWLVKVRSPEYASLLQKMK
ncbi:MAG: TIR domain-containing protein [Phycisphaerae bacterium]|nr:TIR domain-containing protein [Phycisphaerae bacterium]